jgi:uncharacterized RDD family membrane protein YckC
MTGFDIIETPENVELQQRLAGIGSRFVAGLLDHILIFGATLIVVVITVVAGDLAALASLADPRAHLFWFMAFLAAWLLLYVGYFAVLEWLAGGRTLGKMAMQVRVVRQGGGAAGFLDILVRNALRIVDGLPGFLYGVGGVSMFVSGRFQRLGDLAAGTVVVAEGVHDYSARADHRSRLGWERQTSPEALRATGLSPTEYRLLVNYWLRRGELALEARLRLLPRILGPILRRSGVAARGMNLADLEASAADLLGRAIEAERAAGTPSSPSPGPGPREAAP